MLDGVCVCVWGGGGGAAGGGGRGCLCVGGVVCSLAKHIVAYEEAG